ncbi:MAG: DUF896 domain-containing protein [Clostridia bacterium]|nr:DUF896 domain-containing protein [Clostridia bacterium]
MEQEKILRINELAKKQRKEGLSPEETAEQAALRKEYLEDFRASFQGTLDHTVVEYPDGSRKSLSEFKK